MNENEQSMKFEASMQRLEEIVRTLEKGEAPLEDALALFEEGTGLVGRCTTLLDQAELQVVRLMKQPDGTPAEVPFDA
jgi:exodeoxyribonuclease VII small subunit